MADFKLDIPFHLNNPWAFPLRGVPLRCSVPLPEGVVRDAAAELCLRNEANEDLGAQWRALSRWKDGSVRFVLVDYAEACIPPRTERRYRLEKRTAGQPRPPTAIRVMETDSRLEVQTGRLTWTFPTQRHAWAMEKTIISLFHRLVVQSSCPNAVYPSHSLPPSIRRDYLPLFVGDRLRWRFVVRHVSAVSPCAPVFPVIAFS